MPVCFALHGGRIVTAVDAKPKATSALARLENVRATGRASLLVDHYEEDWSELWWVRVDGDAEVIDSEEAIDALAEKYEQYRDRPARRPGHRHRAGAVALLGTLSGREHPLPRQPGRHGRPEGARAGRRCRSAAASRAGSRSRAPGGESYRELDRMIADEGLHTVCQEAACPNIGDCWERGTATFMILGDTCTRRCGFCNVKTGKPTWNDPLEPLRVARSVARMGLRHAVITSVDRDDLPDYGASGVGAA